MTDATKPDGKPRWRAPRLRWSRRRDRSDGLPKSPKPTARRILTLAAFGVGGLAAVAAAVWLAILYLPLPASQVIPRVQAAIQERLGPAYSVSIADAELLRGGDGVELRLVDLAISESGGAPLASIPRAELRLDGIGLLGGNVRVRSVHVTSPRLDLRFDDTVGGGAKNSDLPARVLETIGDLDRLLGPDGAASALEEVDVSGATVRVAPKSRAPLALENVDLRLSRGVGGAFALTASSAKRDDRWTTAITVSAPNADRARDVDLGLQNVDLAPYSAPFAEKAGAPPLSGRLTGHLNARIARDGTLQAGDLRLEARALSVAVAPKAPDEQSRTMAIDQAEIGMRWDPKERVVRIEPSLMRGRGGQLSLTGSLAAPPQAGKPWIAKIDGRDALLASETPGEPPLRLDRIDVEASFDPTAGVLEVSRAQMIGPTASAALNVLVRFEGESPAIRLGLTSTPMPASAVKRLWPFFLAASVRGWIIENVNAGLVDHVNLTIDLPPGALAKLGPKDALPDGSMFLDIGFTEGVLRGRPGLPWIEGAKGKVVSTARRTDVMIEEAVVSGAPEDGPLKVTDVKFSVPDLGLRYPKANLTLKMDGGLRRTLGLVAAGSFGKNPLPAQLKIPDVSGRISGDVRVDLELDHAPEPAPEPVINMNAAMRDVKIANLFANRNFEKGSLDLKVADGPPTLTGKGSVGGAPATVNLYEEPGPDGAAKRKLTATLTADAGDLTRLGLDVPGTLKGSVPLVADIVIDDPKAPLTVKADLAGVGIDGLVPGFSKASGRSGKLAFVVDRGPDKTTIRDFVLESGDRSVRGAIEFGPKGDLLSATLPIYRPGPGDDAKVEIDKSRAGVTRVSLQGAALDLKPLLDAYRKKSAAKASAGGGNDQSSIPKSLDVAVKLGTGLGYDGEAVAGLDLKITMRDGKVTDADGSGRLGRGAIKLSTGENGRIRLTGGDAGAALRFADFYGRVSGGAFDLDAALAGGPGVLMIRDFAVTNENTLERVRRTTNADQGATPPARGATRFDRLRVNFVQGGGQLAVEEAVVYGPTLGATLAGNVNYAGDRVELVGTFVPVYALNNLFSRVPIIGPLLGGGQYGGLLGVTFRVRGPTGAPIVTVNPMSAVAPGFFRKMFEFRQGGGRTAGQGGQTPAGPASAQPLPVPPPPNAGTQQ